MAKKSPEDQNEIPFLEKFMVSQTYDIFRFGGEEIKNLRWNRSSARSLPRRKSPTVLQIRRSQR